ncbi:5763_t:CDS:2, partial [Paraglomus occultum]
ENRNNLQVASSSAVTQARSGTSESQDYQKVQKDLNYKETFDDNGDIITDGTSDADSYLRKAVESMVGNMESDAVTVDDFDLEEVFEKYCDECENVFDDIMDLRPTSQLTKIIPEVTWEKFILDTYPDYKIPENGKNQYKPKDTFAEWEKTWRGLFDEKESNEDLVIKDVLHNILSPYIEAFKAPFNILKSSDLEEKQYSAQFVIPVLKNTLKAVCDVDWRVLEVPIRSSKYRRNSNINPFIDKILSAKRADGLARLWRSQEEIFIYEQTGPPDVDDITDFYIHDYKLVRTMRDVLNQRIILRLHNGIKDYNNLASFGALGHRDEVSLLWCTIHPKSYCLREYGCFRIPAIWQDLPLLSEAIISCLKYFSFMKNSITKIEPHIEQKLKLLAKRKGYAELIGDLRKGFKVYIPMFASAEMAEAELASHGNKATPVMTCGTVKTYYALSVIDVMLRNILKFIAIKHLLPMEGGFTGRNASLETHLYNAPPSQCI